MTDDRLMTRKEVEARCGIKHRLLYELMRRGDFPEPLQIGPQAVRWQQSEVEAWIASRPRARARRAAAA